MLSGPAMLQIPIRGPTQATLASDLNFIFFLDPRTEVTIPQHSEFWSVPELGQVAFPLSGRHEIGRGY
ncbi:Hypothetical predicted protein [Olea europaea subsp. europaea]|uniref:Uncharacterized protein n=1 Tax=Olea europaea subsp. europaea TaxID=158383 RepID=A0A8S0QEA3_OLEEU|nr:Hypothetical predicted protein [Olea europaea subsp. europaea]